MSESVFERLSIARHCILELVDIFVESTVEVKTRPALPPISEFRIDSFYDGSSKLYAEVRSIFAGERVSSSHTVHYLPQFVVKNAAAFILCSRRQFRNRAVFPLLSLRRLVFVPFRTKKALSLLSTHVK